VRNNVLTGTLQQTAQLLSIFPNISKFNSCTCAAQLSRKLYKRAGFFVCLQKILGYITSMFYGWLDGWM
jgi:hypothetical protein